MKVIYRPGLPGELLAPPGINALRQNLMHVLTPMHVHECTSSFKMHKWSENISEVYIIKTEQRNTCKLRMNGVSHTHTKCWQRREANTMATGGIVASNWLERVGGG